jgi:GAF domain-containing protein
MPDPDQALTSSLRALSRFLLGDETPREGLLRIAQLGESAMQGASVTGMTLVDHDGSPKTFVFTGDEAPEVDQLQYDEGDGPCLDAYRKRHVVRVDSNRTDGRWPLFAKRAMERGILSSLSIPLVVGDSGLGAINFYAHTENAFSEADARVGTAFAEQAAVILANAQAYWGAREHSLHLDEAMRSRAVIEQAKGILMARANISADAAFDVLRRASQRENRKVRDLAAELVARTEAGSPHADL